MSSPFKKAKTEGSFSTPPTQNLSPSVFQPLAPTQNQPQSQTLSPLLHQGSGNSLIFPMIQMPVQQPITLQAPIQFHVSNTNVNMTDVAPPTLQSPQVSTPQLQFTPIDTSKQDTQIEIIKQVSQQAPVKAPPRVSFRIDETGKVIYQSKDTQSGQTYTDMSPDSFRAFKGGGKRWGSNKYTDLSSMTHYAYDKSKDTFHEFDKTKPGGFGTAISDKNRDEELRKKKSSGELMDRSRDDRRGSDIHPYDVGHYKKKAANSKMDVLTGKQEVSGFESANRDHIPSGESLNLRNNGGKGEETDAYKEGLTIAIPNLTMHQPYSDTFGGRQSSKDTVDNVKLSRKDEDAQHPALALHRDISTMLDKTEGQKLGTHALLDLTKPESRQTQVGAYRTLFHQNVKMNAQDPKRGIDPAETRISFTPSTTKRGSIGPFTNKTVSTEKQGPHIAEMLTTHLGKTINPNKN